MTTKKVKLEPPKTMRRVLVAVPVHDKKPTSEFLNSWTNLLVRGESLWPERDISFTLRTLDGESLITRGRNQLIRDFMEARDENGESVFTHILFIDSDIGFTLNNVKRLVDSGYDVAAGIYPIKMFNWAAVLEKGLPPQTPIAAVMQALTVPVTNGVMHDTVSDEDGFAEAVEAGTGFMLVSRTAVEKMRAAWPDRLPNGCHSWYMTDYRQGENVRIDNFFDDMVVDWPDHDPTTGAELDTTHPRLLSEDYAFCWLWRQLGGKVYVDVAGEVLAHMGFYTWGRA